jgi:riboflavin biosynthesis pyrimidine reductase
VSDPAAPIDVLLGPGTGSRIDADDLPGLARWYESPQIGPDQATGTYVRASMVASVDGASTAGGVSGSISPPVDRSVFRVQRAWADVIVVGSGTARDENYGPWEVPPALAAARTARGQAVAPVIAQVSGSGNIHTGRGLFERGTGPLAAVVVAGTSDPETLQRLRRVAGTDGVISAAAAAGGADLALMMAEFGRRGWHRVLCEGGPSLLGAMVTAGLVDELCLTVSPLLCVAGSPRITSGTAEPAGGPLPVTLHGLAAAGSVLLSRWRYERGQPLV